MNGEEKGWLTVLVGVLLFFFSILYFGHIEEMKYIEKGYTKCISPGTSGNIWAKNCNNVVVGKGDKR